jgi:hypothetical protein
MTSPPRRATASDVDDVVTILTGAFADDPTWSWVFPDQSLRTEQLSRLWALLVEGAMRYPWVWLTDGATAASVWIPPGGTDLSAEQEAAFEPAVVELMGSQAERVLDAVESFERAHPRDEPHFFLSLLGTHVGHRGRGLGLGLLAANLRDIDATGMPAYLEASNPVRVRGARRLHRARRRSGGRHDVACRQVGQEPGLTGATRRAQSDCGVVGGLPGCKTRASAREGASDGLEAQPLPQLCR